MDQPIRTTFEVSDKKYPNIDLPNWMTDIKE